MEESDSPRQGWGRRRSYGGERSSAGFRKMFNVILIGGLAITMLSLFSNSLVVSRSLLDSDVSDVAIMDTVTKQMKDYENQLSSLQSRFAKFEDDLEQVSNETQISLLQSRLAKIEQDLELVHANDSHAAVTTTLPHTNADTATTTEAEPIVPRLVSNNVGVDSGEIHSNSNNASLVYPKESAAIISFIIPSTLSRATLNRTIESLQNQTRSNWEAIVGVDLAISNLTEKQVASGSLIFIQDRRVRYVPISTVGTNRGEKSNGAGEVRNQMIRNYATAKWVAFVDDDDTLSPDYIKHWETGRQHDQSADVIIFRMEIDRKGIVPPLVHGSIASKNNVGISFAVRKELFVRKQNGIAFVPHRAEDYNFLKLAQTCNATILISTDCVTYFVRQQPRISRYRTSCRFENATIADRYTPPRKKPRFENTTIADTHPPTTTLDDLDPTKMCFVTSEFSDSVEDADILPVVPDDMRTTPGRHFVFTNLEDLPALGWDKIVLQKDDAELSHFQRQITRSRWPKFMGWQHAKLQHCQVIFYGDAYFMNPVNASVWMDFGRRIRASDVGLMQDKQVGRRIKDGPIRELEHAVDIKKLSWEAANYTIQWLRNRTDYQTRTRVYKNALFGYDPANAKFQAFVTEFWQEYSKEAGSWRDQPYWAYFLSRHNMRPISFPVNPPKGVRGKQGHNGHVYVQKEVASIAKV
jgi:hypothetical protein